MTKLRAALLWTAGAFALVSGIAAGCKVEDAVLAPYTAGGRGLSTMTIEDSVFVPRVTWTGGYVTAFGVNRGTTANLDTSLIWLSYKAGDGIPYPAKMNVLSPGAQDMTAGFGGHTQAVLSEDNRYTFWVLKAEAWGLVSAHPGKPVVADSTIQPPAQFVHDTLRVKPDYFLQKTALTDVYINITDVNAFGRLIVDPNTFATNMNVTASDTCNRPVVTWTIVQAGITDQQVAAIGICEGNDYNANAQIWQMISKTVYPDTTIYWKDNVVSQPIRMGDHVPGSITFTEYPAAGMRRGVVYYCWIATKSWDGRNRTRVTNNYGYCTFTVR